MWVLSKQETEIINLSFKCTRSIMRACENLMRPDRLQSDAVDVRQELDLRIGTLYCSYTVIQFPDFSFLVFMILHVLIRVNTLKNIRYFPRCFQWYFIYLLTNVDQLLQYWLLLLSYVGAAFTRFQTLRLQRTFAAQLRDQLISYG